MTGDPQTPSLSRCRAPWSKSRQRHGGGGSVYDASGNFIQAFSLPAGEYAPAISVKYFTAATMDGNVMIYDATGQHLYSAAVSSAVPEPGTLALALPGLLAPAVLPRIAKRRQGSAAALNK